MKIEKFELDGDRATFTLTGARSGAANALRRSINGSVACFAIDRITFYENTSSMFDEYIAHRIGLVPIKTPASGYNDKDEILFTLEATGPATVYSKELVSADKEVEVANDRIPLIKLGRSRR
jgi:DNA-directed RNA polymerase subunit D